MLFPLFLSSTAEEDHYTSAQQADSPRDPTARPNLTAPPQLRSRAQVKDAATPAVGPDAELRPRPGGKVFVEARTSVWTETEAGAGGTGFAGTGIMTEAHAWAEAGWRPVDAEEGVPGDPAPMLGQEQGGEVRREEAFSSVLTALTETAALQAPTVRKPLGLLSKAAWTKTLSSSSKAGSSSTTKASSVASSSSSSSSSPSSHAAVTANVSVVLGNNNSSDNNSFGTY